MRNTKYEIRGRKGAALLVVLFIVMATTILSLGYLTRSDVELACGENMTLRTEMDYLAESALEHAKGLILSPQDIDSEYWAGAEQLQLLEGSNDYYDVNVVKLGNCNYRITCEAYRQNAGEKTGRSSLTAELRINPCIALWTGSTFNSKNRITIDGDVYCEGNPKGSGNINGDVFAKGEITADNIQGQKNQYVADAPVTLPPLEISYFSGGYYNGSQACTTYVSDANVHPAGSFNPTANNPAGVRYYNGALEMQGSVNITGMLIVDGDLTVSGTNNVITAVKNFPALLVNGALIIKTGSELEINGLAQVNQSISITGGDGIDIDVTGCLVIANGDINGASDNSIIEITASPDDAAIQIWADPDNCIRWTPAAGAFFRSIERN